MTSDIMTDFVEIPDDNSSDTEVQERQPPPAPTSNNHEFDDLRTLKNEMEFRGSLLGKTWSELSNIMTRYQAQIIQKHEQLNSNLSGAERSRISQMDTNLKKSFSEIERLRKQVTDLESKLLEKDSEIVTLRTECHKYKNEVGMKDNLIHKIQAQMAQEALDYQTEISSLKDLLESGQVDYGTQDMVPVAMPVHQPPKRRKVTPKPLTPRTPQRVQPITPNKSQSFSSPQQQAQSMASTSSTNIQPGSAVVKAESFQSCQLTPSSSSMNQDAEMDASYADQTFEQDDQGQDTGYFKVDEVYDDSNSSAIEGLIQQQDPGMEQQAGQEQILFPAGCREATQKLSFCPICAKAFKKSNGLKRHLRVHSGAKPFECLICKVTFKFRWHCRQHLKKVHGRKEPELVRYLQDDDNDDEFMLDIATWQQSDSQRQEIGNNQEDFLNHVDSIRPNKPPGKNNEDPRWQTIRLVEIAEEEVEMKQESQ